MTRHACGRVSGFSGTAKRMLSGAAGALILPAGLMCPGALRAEEGIPLPPIPVETVSPDEGLSLPLSGGTLGGREIDARRLSTSDTAKLLEAIPGVTTYGAGAISGLPAIHGLADDRVKTLVNGVPMVQACPNHMNSPLSYIDPAAVQKIEVLAGITPVSAGGDSIAGTVKVESAPPVFAGPGETLHAEGGFSTYYRSNSHGLGGSVTGTAATQEYSANYTGTFSRADDYHDGDGTRIERTSFENRTHTGLVARRDAEGNVLEVRGGHIYLPEEGFPNQYMDMTANHNTFANSRYRGRYGWGDLDAGVNAQYVTHTMDKLAETGGYMPMDTESLSFGYAVKGSIPISSRTTLRIGNEFQRENLDDWWDPVVPSGGMSPLVYKNISDGERNRLGTFIEWESKWSPAWTTQLGARNDTVWMDTGNVQPYSWTSAMSASDQTAAMEFNAKDHARTDVNLDLTALVRYEPDRTSTYEAGLARKTRSPNLYERYSWGRGSMSSRMIGWYGDLNGYVGNLELDPEVAYTASLTGNWHDDQRKNWEIGATPYFTYVKDYIDVDKLRFLGVFNQLKFANHDAILFGIDINGRKVLVEKSDFGAFALSGGIGYTHGERTDNNESLYHIMPVHGKLGLEHKIFDLTSVIETVMVARKSDRDHLRFEPTTPAYALLNLRFMYQFLETAHVDLAFENLLDKKYYAPLGGADSISSSKHGRARPIAAEGRSINAGLTWNF